MEQNKAERLNENVTEKMCSSDGNVVGEMCSPADADTCGDGLPSVEKSSINQRFLRFGQKNRCVFLFLQSGYEETDLPHGIGFVERMIYNLAKGYFLAKVNL